jgi:hypothetical protein
VEPGRKSGIRMLDAGYLSPGYQRYAGTVIRSEANGPLQVKDSAVRYKTKVMYADQI